MKKVLLSLLAGIILVPTQASMAANLLDVERESEYFKAVDVFTSEGIIQGYDDGTFKPNQPINRAEALKIVLIAFQLENSKQAEIIFNDVSDDDWFGQYVSVGVEKGIVQGYGDGSFRPGNQVNFVEALKMGLEAKGVDTTSLEFRNVREDIGAGQWYSNMFSYGYDVNLFDSEVDGSLNPGKLMSRAEFTELMYRVRALPSNGEFDITYNWKKHSGRTAVSLSLPVEWKSFDFGGNGVLVGNDLEEGLKIDFLDRELNESRALMYMSGINEDLGADDYLSEVKTGLGSGWEFYEEAKLDGKFLIASNIGEGMIRYHYWVENGKVIIGEVEFNGDSLKRYDFEKVYEALFRQVVASDSPGIATIQERLNEVRKSILVEGAGMDTIELFIDKTIIETDVVGVGTGPVDYYYVPLIDYTLKYERADDVILDIMEGETIDF